MDALKITDKFLESQRSLTDPIADDFVSNASHTLSKKELYLFLRTLLDEFTLTGGHPLSAEMKTYVQEITPTPEWADPLLIKQGQDFYKLHAPEIGLALLMKALPSTYCCWRGASVVHAAGRLTNHSGNLKPFTRRLMETAKFVINVCTDEGLKPDGLGIFAAAKVRTLHAFIRHFLNDMHWDSATLGQPINQEDLAGTMLAFSVFVVQGLEHVGIKVSSQEKQSYYHLWRVIGHTMGVQEQMLPESYDDAEELGEAILKHQKGASPEGKEMTQACVTFLENMMPFGFFKFIPRNFMYVFMGEELSAMGGIKKSSNIFARFVVFASLKFLGFIEWLKHHVGFIARFARWFNPKILNWTIKKFLKQLNQPFTPEIIQKEVNVLTGNRH